MEAVTYFQLRQVHFFASYGIIRIDLPLLLSVSSEKNNISKSISVLKKKIYIKNTYNKDKKHFVSGNVMFETFI